MISVRPSYTRGRSRHDWLDSRHTFSFADYFDPSHMGFSVLRVINDDRVAPGGGFPSHHHRDMEIITYVLEGGLVHRDDTGNETLLRAGEMQLMSAGSGIVHSEFNASDRDPVHFLQIWITPAQRGLMPSYSQSRPAGLAARNRFQLMVSPEGRDNSLLIHQDARIYLAQLSPQIEVSHELIPGRKAYVQVTSGAIYMKGQIMAAGDGAAVQEESGLMMSTEEGGEVLLFDLP